MVRAELQNSGYGDLDALETNIRNGIRAEFYEAMNRQIKWQVGFAAVWTTVLLTAVRLIG